ncbi:hypothetical protein TYRP_016218 [Tyrophagus putrescentiae]|nr:hypothetical protein TYRP_016218 [Tyrophagus putrescentiae]
MKRINGFHGLQGTRLGSQVSSASERFLARQSAGDEKRLLFRFLDRSAFVTGFCSCSARERMVPGGGGQR